MRALVLGKRLAQPGKIFSEFDGLGLGHYPLAWLVEACASIRSEYCSKPNCRYRLT